MADITYTDKNKTLPTSDPARKWRDVDANEVKTVVNAKADKEELKSANFTAENDGRYITDTSLTVTDPVTPVAGKGYEVFVRNGTTTIDSVEYTAGKLLKRVYYSGSWSTTDITAGSGGGGGIPDAPSDDFLYARFNNSWVPLNSVLEVGGGYTLTAALNQYCVFSTAAQNLLLNNVVVGFKAIVRNKGAHTTTFVAGVGITINGGTTLVGDNAACFVIQRSASIWEVIPIGSGSGGSGVDVEDEGTPVVTATTLNFVGAGVTVTDVGGVATVTISGGGGGGGSYVGPIGTKQTPAISSNLLTLDMASGANNLFLVTLDDDITGITLDNPPAAGTTCKFKLQLVGDGIARTITWPTEVRWPFNIPPTPTATSNKLDEYEFHTHDGGATYYASVVGQNYDL